MLDDGVRPAERASSARGDACRAVQCRVKGLKRKEGKAAVQEGTELVHVGAVEFFRAGQVSRDSIRPHLGRYLVEENAAEDPVAVLVEGGIER